MKNDARRFRHGTDLPSSLFDLWSLIFDFPLTLVGAFNRRWPSQRPKYKDQRPFFEKFSGGCVERVTPVPIPNTEVKPLGADGTARATVWESRKPPGFNKKPAREISRAFPLTSFLSAISNFLHPLRLHVTKSRRNLRHGLSGSIPSLPLGILTQTTTLLTRGLLPGTTDECAGYCRFVRCATQPDISPLIPYNHSASRLGATGFDRGRNVRRDACRASSL